VTTFFLSIPLTKCAMNYQTLTVAKKNLHNNVFEYL
jgi:hypothetical protein